MILVVFWCTLSGYLKKLSTELLNMGVVLEVKIETKGFASYKLGKARFALELSSLLLSRMVATYEGKEIWLDFRYDGHPHFSLSVGNRILF